jgi:DNA-binding beta-propeller fold protein YncE
MVSLPIFLTDSKVLDAHTIVSDYDLKPISLPGGNGVVLLDHLAYDRARGRVWVPASNTGNVDVINEASDAMSPISGFKTGEVELEGHKVKLGLTAANVGDRVVYIGNRDDSTLSIINSEPLSAENVADDAGVAGNERITARCCLCSDDIRHGGKVTDSVTTGGGLDDIDFSAEQKGLYAAASVTATLTIAEVSDDGKFHVRALLPTARERAV